MLGLRRARFASLDSRGGCPYVPFFFFFLLNRLFFDPSFFLTGNASLLRWVDARVKNLRWGAPDEGVRGYTSIGRMVGENRVSG
jgi:hypothetical protein